MERANTRETKLAIAFVKDAIMRLQSTTEEVTKVDKQNIVENTRDYNIPVDMVAIKNISVLDTEDDNKYKLIRRLANEPVITEDTNT